MPDDPKSRIATNIAAMRKARRLTQQALADAIGVTKQAVYYWEAGTNRPSPDWELKLAELFGVSVSALHAEGAGRRPGRARFRGP